MSEDRLADIKKAYPFPCGFPTIDWLISEVERLREALAWIADDDPANSYEWQLIARKALATPHGAGQRVEKLDG